MKAKPKPKVIAIINGHDMGYYGDQNAMIYFVDNRLLLDTAEQIYGQRFAKRVWRQYEYVLLSDGSLL